MPKNKFDKTKIDDIINLRMELERCPNVLWFLEDICFHDVPNIALNANEHFLISGAKNVYLTLKQVIRKDLSPEQVTEIFKKGN